MVQTTGAASHSDIAPTQIELITPKLKIQGKADPEEVERMEKENSRSEPAVQTIDRPQEGKGEAKGETGSKSRGHGRRYQRQRTHQSDRHHTRGSKGRELSNIKRSINKEDTPLARSGWH